jgi:hypothetical protein
MPTKRLTMRGIHRLMTLHFGAGAGTREIARELSISHSTVREYLARIRTAGITWPLPTEITDQELERQLFVNGGVQTGARYHVEPDWAVVARELKRPGVNLLILWEEYRASHSDGYAYSRFCQLFREFERRLSPSMRQSHVAGDKAFVDFSGKRVPIIDPATGVIREAEIFVAVLGASNLTYAEAAWTQSLPDWIGAHVRMFRFWGASPRLLVCDFVPGNKIVVMCPTPLCGVGRGLGRLRGGPRTLGHITGYSAFSQSSRVLSLFQAARVRDAAEIPEPTSQTRRASALARKVNSA